MFRTSAVSLFPGLRTASVNRIKSDPAGRCPYDSPKGAGELDTRALATSDTVAGTKSWLVFERGCGLGNAELADAYPTDIMRRPRARRL